MTYMIVSVNAAGFMQRAFETNRSVHPFIPTMTCTGLPNHVVRKKYDSVNLYPRTENQYPE